MSWVSTNKLTQLANSLRNKFTTNELVLANSDKSKGAYLNVGGQDGLITMSPMVEDGSTPAALWVTDSAANNATELTGGTLSYVTDVGADTEDYTSLSLVGGVVNVSGKNGAQRRITNVAAPIKSTDVATNWDTVIKTTYFLMNGMTMISGSDTISVNNNMTGSEVFVRLPKLSYSRYSFDTKYLGLYYALRIPYFTHRYTPTSDKTVFSYYLTKYPCETGAQDNLQVIETTRAHVLCTRGSSPKIVGMAFISSGWYVLDSIYYPKIQVTLSIPEENWTTVGTNELECLSPYVILFTNEALLFPED